MGTLLQDLIRKAHAQGQQPSVHIAKREDELTDANIRLAHEYVENGFDFNKAYRKVNGPATPQTVAMARIRHMHRKKWMALVREIAEPILAESQIRKSEALALLTAQCWVAITDFMDRDGNITPESIRRTPMYMQRCIKRIEFDILKNTRTDANGEKTIEEKTVVKKIELHDSQKAISIIKDILGWQESDAGGLEGFAQLMAQMANARRRLEAPE